MATMQELEALTGSIRLPAPILHTRFAVSELDPPYLAPPYSSLMDDVLMDARIHLYKDKLRQIALHPVKLHAGQANMPGGELGRPAARHPVLAPEMLGGHILATNV